MGKVPSADEKVNLFPLYLAFCRHSLQQDDLERKGWFPVSSAEHATNYPYSKRIDFEISIDAFHLLIGPTKNPFHYVLQLR